MLASPVSFSLCVAESPWASRQGQSVLVREGRWLPCDAFSAHSLLCLLPLAVMWRSLDSRAAVGGGAGC